MAPSLTKTVILSIITMTAFALNSVFGRLALSVDAIDPASYTTIRLASGAIMLFLLVALRGGFKKDLSPPPFVSGTGVSAIALFVYAAFFSFAYITLDTGVGALILFACVQATMIGWGLFTGERPSIQAWIGIVLAIGGFVYLVSPGLKAPDPFGAILMAIAGIAWGVYSLKGKGLSDPLRATARNFIWSVPLGVVLVLIFLSQQKLEYHGVVLAIASGAVTSALGYALWYVTLKGLTANKAAILQLTVPVIATFFGIAILGEPLTQRFMIATICILGGVALSILAKEKKLG
ncbi:MAG: DMT family transporter [Hyphomicrobiales bacterium]